MVMSKASGQFALLPISSKSDPPPKKKKKKKEEEKFTRYLTTYLIFYVTGECLFMCHNARLFSVQGYPSLCVG